MQAGHSTAAALDCPAAQPTPMRQAPALLLTRPVLRCFPPTQHAIGHVAANLSFAAVAISLTHTVKTLEPAFNVVLSQVGLRSQKC